VDELLFYIAPKLLGASARGMLHLPGFEAVDEAVQLEISDLRRFGPDLRILARPVPRTTP
jgi:diaminohydroxyphosphoribosylaminopyrimidine deaminase/5-amino-6-(5-phosphoribosylamino)uracil reductase